MMPIGSSPLSAHAAGRLWLGSRERAVVEEDRDPPLPSPVPAWSVGQNDEVPRWRMHVYLVIDLGLLEF